MDVKAWLENWWATPGAEKLVEAVVGLVLLYGVGRLVRRAILREVEDSATRYRARKLVSFALFAAGALFLLSLFSDKLGSLTVAFGVAGAGIAFALQEVIASVAGWVAISFGNFYRTGDRVQVGGVAGDVIDIGVLRTAVMEIGQWVKADLYNGRIVRIANSSIFKEPVFNYSADFPFLWDEITIPVRYGSDWKHARDVFVRTAEEVCGDFAVHSKEAWSRAVTKYRLDDAKVEPAITMVANDNWLEFTLRYIVDYRQRRSVKSQLFTRILEEVDASADHIRLASTTVELVGVPKLDIDATGGTPRA